MRPQLMTHCGGNVATLEDLRLVPLPEETSSYKPLSHYDLVMNIQRVASDMLRDHTFEKGSYALANNGSRLFGVHTYWTEANDLALAIGFRNSYDKSMSVGIAIGASVFVCDNLMFTGTITVLRKHTLNVIDDLETAILKVVYKARHQFTRITESAEQLRSLPLEDDDAFKMLGLLFGHKVLTPRQLPVARAEWLTPSHKAFQPRNSWSFYNAVTAALKSTPPQRILERHLALHDLMTKGT